MKIINGLQFKSRWFDGIVTVENSDYIMNELYVKIKSPMGGEWHETWDFQHAIWGFKIGDYTTDLNFEWL